MFFKRKQPQSAAGLTVQTLFEEAAIICKNVGLPINRKNIEWILKWCFDAQNNSTKAEPKEERISLSETSSNE